MLNKLTPQKFHTLVSQVQALPIDSNERLMGVINLVFEKVRQASVKAAALIYRCHVLKIILRHRIMYTNCFCTFSIIWDALGRSENCIRLLDYDYNYNWQ